MSDMDEIAGTARQPRAARGAGERQRPEDPKGVVLVLSKKPESLEKPIGLYVEPKTKAERAVAAAEAGPDARYVKVPVWPEKMYEVVGIPLTDYPGGKATFRDPEEVEAEWKQRVEQAQAAGAKPPGRPQGVMFNGKRVFPAGEPVRVLIPITQGEDRLKPNGPGSVVVLEGVCAYAPALPRQGQPNPKGTYSHAPSSVLAKKDKDGNPVGVLVAYNDAQRRYQKDDKPSPVQGFFHTATTPQTRANRFAFTGVSGFVGRPFVSTKSDREAGPNDTPFMRRHRDSTALVCLESDPGMSLTTSSLEEIREFMNGWDEHRKSQPLPAPNGMEVEDESLLVPGQSAALVRFFRVRYETDEQGNKVAITDPARLQASYEEFKSLTDGKGNKVYPSPYASFVVMGHQGREKDEQGNYRQVSLLEAFDAFVKEHDGNVDKFEGRKAANSAELSMQPRRMQDILEGGNWVCQVIPGMAVNLAPTIRSRIEKFETEGKGFDPRSDFRALVRGSDELNVKLKDRDDISGPCYPYDQFLAVRNVTSGIIASYKGEAPGSLRLFSKEGFKEAAFDIIAVSEARTDENGDPKQVFTGYIASDIRPLVKDSRSAPPVPGEFVLPEVVPEPFRAAVAHEVETLGRNQTAANFAWSDAMKRKRAAGAAPKPDEDEDAPEGPSL